MAPRASRTTEPPTVLCPTITTTTANNMKENMALQRIIAEKTRRDVTASCKQTLGTALRMFFLKVTSRPVQMQAAVQGFADVDRRVRMRRKAI